MPHNLLYLEEELPKPNYNISNSKLINIKSNISNLDDSLKFNENEFFVFRYNILNIK